MNGDSLRSGVRQTRLPPNFWIQVGMHHAGRGQTISLLEEERELNTHEALAGARLHGSDDQSRYRSHLQGQSQPFST